MDLPSPRTSSYFNQSSYDALRLARFKADLKTDMGVVPENKIPLLKFITHMENKGITISRCRSSFADLLWFAYRIKKPWMDCTRDDMDALIVELRRTKYSGWSKLRRAFVLKTFYKFMNGGDAFPHCVAKLNRTELNFETSNLESRDILSRDDLKQLLQVCNSEIESAILYCLWECGARSSEFLRITIGDLEDKGNFFLVHLRTSKIRAASNTPKIRKFPLVESFPYLRAYLNKHPLRTSPNAPLWLSNSQNHLGQPLTDRGLRYVIKSVAKRAKLGKRVWVHQFRHSAATRMAPKLNLPIMNDLMGWSKTSRMHATYVQLDGEASKNAVLELYGMKTSDEMKPKPIEMLTCPSCKFANQPGNIVCDNCGRALSTIGAVSVMEELEKVKKEMNKMMLPAARGTVARAKREWMRKMQIGQKTE